MGKMWCLLGLHSWNIEEEPDVGYVRCKRCGKWLRDEDPMTDPLFARDIRAHARILVRKDKNEQG